MSRDRAYLNFFTAIAFLIGLTQIWLNPNFERFGGPALLILIFTCFIGLVSIVFSCKDKGYLKPAIICVLTSMGAALIIIIGLLGSL